MANEHMKGYGPFGSNTIGLQGNGYADSASEDRISRLMSMELRYVQQYAEIRAENKRPMKYNSLETFDVPHPGKFSRLASPQISLKYRQMSFSTSAILAFAGLPYIVPLKDFTNQKIAVLPIAEEELESVKWARMKDDKWIPRTITAVDYVDEIYAYMNWKRDARYKILADIVNTPRGLALMFDLPAAVEVTKEKEEYVNPLTGEIKQRQIRHFPDRYKDGAGKPFSEYDADRKRKQFNNLESFEGSGQLLAGAESAMSDSERLETQADKTNLEFLSDNTREALSRFGRIEGLQADSDQATNDRDNMADEQMTIPVVPSYPQHSNNQDKQDGEQVGSE